MSEKGKSQNEASQKIVTRYDRKVQRRKEEELKAKKRKQISRVVGIVILAAIVIGLASIPVRNYAASHSTYITVGGHDITKVEFDYYYNLASSDYINTYGTYLAYMGFNASGDYASQAYSDTMSWKDYFEQLAVDTIRQNKALVDAAHAAGFTYDTSQEYAAFAESAKTAAAAAGESLNRYYKLTFGRYSTVSGLKPYVEEGYLASAYYKHVAEEKAASADEIQAYYDENKESYDSVDYKLTEISAEIPEAQTVTDENGNVNTVEPTEEEIQAAMDAAKEEADAALLVIAEEGTEHNGMLRANISSKYRDWLFDEARKEGDTTIIEDADGHKYYVLQFVKRYLEDTATADVRVIATTAGNGEDILAEYNAAGATEDAFIELVRKYSEDNYSMSEDGLYKEVTSNSLNSAFSEWVFEEGRKPGDTVSLVQDGTSFVLYYIGEGRPEWQVSIANTLLSETMSNYLDEIKEGCEVSDPKGRLVYLKVQAAANAGSDSQATEPADEGGEGQAE
ncbi:MAG: peptidylprolyl isomerase [Lachnospiraceae bacterium]|nr:peptidylprolyl isomerase [Lachnospiraceae bacterium]